MIGRLLALDALIARTRPLWAGLGQLALIVLGVHLAADKVDDVLYNALLASPLPWESPDSAVIYARWGAVILEFAVVARAIGAIALTSHAPTRTFAEWKRDWSVDAVVLPLFWFVCALAGAWVVGMVVEDAVATRIPALATPASLLTTLIIGWRLGVSGVVRVIGGLDAPKRRGEGLLWAVPLLLVTALAARHGLPIWGWT